MKSKFNENLFRLNTLLRFCLTLSEEGFFEYSYDRLNLDKVYLFKVCIPNDILFIPCCNSYSVFYIYWGFISNVIYVLLLIPFSKYLKIELKLDGDNRLGVPPPKYKD